MRWVFVFILLASVVHAATLQGMVYDWSLEPVDAVVEINTMPRQVAVAKHGYSFTAPAGEYTIKARKGDDVISENITILDDGSYVLDLILLPDLSIEESLMQSSDEIIQDFPIPEDEPFNPYLTLIIVGVLALVLVVVKILRKKDHTKLDPDLRAIMDLITKSGGRVSQKEIYKQLPWSEAKVSLMLDDLESRQLIRKIKKGRANIIVRK